MSYYRVTYYDELYHHGIKGQKWGNRRFQNEDGSLTDAGRARYDVGEARRAALTGGLIGYAHYRKTHSGRDEAIAKYKKDKAKAKAKKKQDRIKAATKRDYEFAKKRGLVKNRKEYDQVMRNEAQRQKTKSGMNSLEKVANVASLGTYGGIKNAEQRYAKAGKDKNGISKDAPNTFGGLGLRAAQRGINTVGYKIGADFSKAFVATAAGVVAGSVGGSAAAKAGAAAVTSLYSKMADVSVLGVAGYNTYAQVRDTANYVKKKTS